MSITAPQIFESKEQAPATAEVISILASEEANDQHVWIYYPWQNKVVHAPAENEYFKLRTNRNRNIITVQEQKNYRETKIGVAGLSVGSAALTSLVRTGGPKVIKIADFDVVEISNLNRMHATLLDVGSNKVDVIARNIWEIDPFAQLFLWESGLNEHNTEEFLLKDPKLDIFIEEMDDITMKILVRKMCRQHKIPVLMATDMGNTIILDVERFDLEPQRPLLHGKMEQLNLQQPWIEIANNILGQENIEERMRESIAQIGKTLSGVPQLGTTAALGGIALSYAVRAIANKQNMPSGRYIINLEETAWKDSKKL